MGRVQTSQIFLLLSVLTTACWNLTLRQTCPCSRSTIQATRTSWVQNWVQNQLVFGPELWMLVPPSNIQATGHFKFVYNPFTNWEQNTVFWYVILVSVIAKIDTLLRWYICPQLDRDAFDCLKTKQNDSYCLVVSNTWVKCFFYFSTYTFTFSDINN